MSHTSHPTLVSQSPLTWIADGVLGVLRYVGGFAILLGAAAKSIARPTKPTRPLFWPAFRRQLSWMIGAGLPIVALVNVSLGSFLAMQAFYGATFTEAAGPVVGIGLFRNLSPMMAGFVLAGLLAARTTRELKFAEKLGPDDDVRWIPGRVDSTSHSGESPHPADPARLAAVRIAAAAVAGPPLAILGACIGMTVGCGVAWSMLGVAAPVYFSKFYEMFWVRDVIGLVLKGVCFGGSAAAFACYEGLRRPDEQDSASLATASFRAVWFSALSVLIMNLGWFVFAYLAGPPWGPTVLPAPGA